MEQPKVGEKVSLWVEGEVQSVRKGAKELIVEVTNEKTHAHCFVPLSAIEPKGGEEHETV